MTVGADERTWPVIDEILADHSVLVITGNGGVGKTTIAAALGLRAATEHGRRVLVVTVDPARRLADALGVNGLPGEAVLVPVGKGDGRLWVLMVEMSQAWDALVNACAPDPDTARELLDNELYRSLTSRFVASHDYVALDHLALLAEGTFDMIVVDTPPGEHSDDILNAPQRLQEFFDSRLLRWLTAGVGGGIGQLAARPFLKVAERLLGGDFLTRISTFFALFARLRPRMVDRIERVQHVLNSDRSAVLEVWAGDGERPSRRPRSSPHAVVVNRVLPGSALEPLDSGSGRVGERRIRLRASVDDGHVEAIEDAQARAGVRALLAGAEDVELVVPDAVDVVMVPRCSGGVNDLRDLRRLIEQAVTTSSHDPVER